MSARKAPRVNQYCVVARQQRLHDGRLAAGDGLEKLVGSSHVVTDPVTPFDKGKQLAQSRQMGRPRNQLQGRPEQRLSRQPIQGHPQFVDQLQLMTATRFFPTS